MLHEESLYFDMLMINMIIIIMNFIIFIHQLKSIVINQTRKEITKYNIEIYNIIKKQM